MRFTIIAFAGLAAAAPAVEKRQSCKYGFVFARGSTEPSPIGILIGPALQTALKSQLPGMQTFPVPYDASLGTNVSNDRTDAKSKNIGVQAFQKAAGCQVLIAGGYSQGAAVMHNVVGTVNGKKSPLPANVRDKIAAVALFGDTRNKQDSGHIKDFPTERSKVWCNASDGVCGGQLNVNAGHLSYSNAQISEAAKYLASAAKSFKGGSAGGGGGDAGGGDAPAEGSAPKMSKGKGGGGKKGKGPGGRMADLEAASQIDSEVAQYV